MSRTLYYLSDEAYDGLWRQAVGHKYIGRGAASGKGMSAYIRAASGVQYRDARPDDFKQMDEARKSQGLTLYWHDGDIRKARLLTLDDETIDNLCIIAVDFLIGIGKSTKKKKLRLRSTTATIARVLEAIGKKWLIPTQLIPVNVKDQPNGQ